MQHLQTENSSSRFKETEISLEQVNRLLT